MKLRLFAAMVALLPASALQAQESKKDTKPEPKVLLRSNGTTWLNNSYGQSLQSIFFGGQVPDKTVSLSVNDVSFEQALKTLCDTASVKYSIDGDTSKDKKITVKVENVKFLTALNLISEAAGVQYAVERKDGVTLIKAGKNVTPHVIYYNENKPGTLSFNNSLNQYNKSLLTTPNNQIKAWRTGTSLNTPLMYQLSYGSEQSTFTCPHCKKQATVVRTKSTPKCPKCDRAFQGDWQFCPADGTKRPADASSWKFCPMCGKGVDDKATSSTVPLLRDIPLIDHLHTNNVVARKIPILGDLPLIGNLFRTNNNVD